MKWGVRMSLAAEDVDCLGWGAFAILDRALRRNGPWPAGELGYWRLAWAEYLLAPDAWLVTFRCWPLGWGECSTCEGRGTSWDESTGGKCWDCRGGGVLPGG